MLFSYSFDIKSGSISFYTSIISLRFCQQVSTTIFQVSNDYKTNDVFIHHDGVSNEQTADIEHLILID